MFHVQKFEISPHDRFFLHGHRPCVRDKYEVWPLREFGNEEFAKNEIQIEIFGCFLLCSFTFNLYLDMS